MSQTPKEQIGQNVQKFCLQNYFDKIVLDKWKPNLKGLFQALEELKIADPLRVVYIGDIKEDLEAAHAADIQPWPIYRREGSFHKLEEIRKGSPKIILKT